MSPGARHLLRLYEVADGKHDVREDGNPNSIRGDVWNCDKASTTAITAIMGEAMNHPFDGA